MTKASYDKRPNQLMTRDTSTCDRQSCSDAAPVHPESRFGAASWLTTGVFWGTLLERESTSGERQKLLTVMSKQVSRHGQFAAFGIESRGQQTMQVKKLKTKTKIQNFGLVPVVQHVFLRA